MKALALVFAFCLPAVGATTITTVFQVSTAIPDNDLVGLADTRTVVSPLTEITEVKVSLNFTGGWNGDLYAYLAHGTGFAVLLNRPGRSAAVPDGFPTAGMSVVLADSASGDIHTADSTLTGLYQPDARAIDPVDSLDTTPRTAFLANFTGLDPNGSWTLFVADAAAGGTSVLQSWSLEIDAVPEPSSSFLALAGGLVLLRRRR